MLISFTFQKVKILKALGDLFERKIISQDEIIM